MKKTFEGQKGFTLVEIIITIAMLAIFSLPVLSYFSDANQHNIKAKVKQNAVVAAQDALEELKAESVDLMKPDKLTDSLNAPDIAKEWTLVSAPDANGVYSVAKPCSVNGSVYKVKADITPVDKFVNGDSNLITYKGMEQPSMNQETDVIATETASAAMDAQVYFYGLYEQYCDNGGTPDSSVTPQSILDHLSKVICIKLDEDPSKPGNALVTVYYRYKYEIQAGESYPGGITASSSYGDETNPIKVKSILGKKLKNIYIFFVAGDKDELAVDAEINPAAIDIDVEQLSLYLSVQNSVKFHTGDGSVPERPDSYKMTLPTTCKNNFHSYFDKVYTNLDVTEVNAGNFGSKMAMDDSSNYILVQKNGKERVAQIKLSVYKGDSLAADNYCLSIEGTKVQN